MDSHEWHIDKVEYRDVLRELISRHAGTVDDLEPLPTWGPTVVMRARLSSGSSVVCESSARQDVHAEATACQLASDEVFGLYRAHNAIDSAVWSVDEGLDWADDLVQHAREWLRVSAFATDV